jgi:hypothetical protein
MEQAIEVECPWCWEYFTTFFDQSAGEQSYVEDCQICCRPILLHFRVTNKGKIKVQATRS